VFARGNGSEAQIVVKNSDSYLKNEKNQIEVENQDISSINKKADTPIMEPCRVRNVSGTRVRTNVLCV